jgi:hypothetical protein
MISSSKRIERALFWARGYSILPSVELLLSCCWTGDAHKIACNKKYNIPSKKQYNNGVGSLSCCASYPLPLDNNNNNNDFVIKKLIKRLIINNRKNNKLL